MNNSSFIKLIWSTFLQSSAKFWCLQQTANIDIDSRIQGFRHIHGKITGSLQPCTLIVSHLTTACIQLGYGGVIINHIIIHYYEILQINRDQVTEQAAIYLGSTKPLPDPNDDFSPRSAIKQFNTFQIQSKNHWETPSFTPAPRSTVTKVTVSEMAELAPSIKGKQRSSRQIDTVFYAQILLWML